MAVYSSCTVRSQRVQSRTISQLHLHLQLGTNGYYFEITVLQLHLHLQLGTSKYHFALTITLFHIARS